MARAPGPCHTNRGVAPARPPGALVSTGAPPNASEHDETAAMGVVQRHSNVEINPWERGRAGALCPSVRRSWSPPIAARRTSALDI